MRDSGADLGGTSLIADAGRVHTFSGTLREHATEAQTMLLSLIRRMGCQDAAWIEEAGPGYPAVQGR